MPAVKKINQAIQLCDKVKARFRLQPAHLSWAVSVAAATLGVPGGSSASLVVLLAGLEHLPTPAPLSLVELPGCFLAGFRLCCVVCTDWFSNAHREWLGAGGRHGLRGGMCLH